MSLICDICKTELKIHKTKEPEDIKKYGFYVEQYICPVCTSIFIFRSESGFFIYPNIYNKDYYKGAIKWI